jgi:hypothetical protein
MVISADPTGTLSAALNREWKFLSETCKLHSLFCSWSIKIDALHFSPILGFANVGAPQSLYWIKRQYSTEAAKPFASLICALSENFGRFLSSRKPKKTG